MKTKVRVTLEARQEVVIEVEHEEDEDETDLTPEDERRAIDAALPYDWDECVARVEVEE